LPRADVVFAGMCDASGAVPLTDSLFAVADDEAKPAPDLRRARRRAAASRATSPSASGSVGRPARNNPTFRGRRPRWTSRAQPGSASWGSGSRRTGGNSAGKSRPERLRFFATTAPARAAPLEVVGTPYLRLLDDLFADSRFARFGLQAAAELPPKAAGGLNVEGLTARAEGGAFIGFRSPTPGARALLVALLNPADVVRGRRARFGDPILLDLGGLGIRALSSWRGRYLIVAGHHANEAASELYTWDGRAAPKRRLEFTAFNPEGFFTPEARDEVMLLSDDGSLPIDGAPCKEQKDAAKKRFRGRWLTLRER
jgi:hypothetical protein